MHLGPEEELVGKIPVADVDYSQMTSQAVAHEIFDSILREIRDEVNISHTNLSPPLLMGIAQNTTSACRPSLEFLVGCSLSKDRVLALYRQGDHAEADESTNIMLVPLSQIITMETTNPTLWAQIAPSAKGCVILYKLCNGL
ncbi:nucleoside diphosphate-linked moiety X motif 22-like isoform X2 [Pomacea canaliculata]|uniref:nucleoside diphosphate-linked moiety X motif 22-like isoform X2 n=1 Tax=Pomacea canaliculata TaxID=400727 RepID=UPI000D731DB6|nr:nucleoside diphosphate-linked moiety X motif 22-like isoform X2 [Pomacea canaliculata]